MVQVRLLQRAIYRAICCKLMQRGVYESVSDNPNTNPLLGNPRKRPPPHRDAEKGYIQHHNSTSPPMRCAHNEEIPSDLSTRSSVCFFRFLVDGLEWGSCVLTVAHVRPVHRQPLRGGMRNGAYLGGGTTKPSQTEMRIDHCHYRREQQQQQREHHPHHHEWVWGLLL